MKIVNLDAYTIHLNDLNWNELAQLGDLVTYDRVAPEDVIPAIEKPTACRSRWPVLEVWQSISR